MCVVSLKCGIKANIWFPYSVRYIINDQLRVCLCVASVVAVPLFLLKLFCECYVFFYIYFKFFFRFVVIILCWISAGESEHVWKGGKVSC